MAISDYTGTRYDVRATTGDDIEESFSFQDSNGDELNLAGYVFSSQIRDDDNQLVATFNCNLSGNRVIRTLSRNFTQNLNGTYRHDLQWTTPMNKVRTLLSGKIVFVNEYTR